MRNIYSDPTANTALGNVMREQRRKENAVRRKGEQPPKKGAFTPQYREYTPPWVRKLREQMEQD